MWRQSQWRWVVSSLSLLKAPLAYLNPSLFFNKTKLEGIVDDSSRLDESKQSAPRYDTTLMPIRHQLEWSNFFYFYRQALEYYAITCIPLGPPCCLQINSFCFKSSNDFLIYSSSTPKWHTYSIDWQQSYLGPSDWITNAWQYLYARIIFLYLTMSYLKPLNIFEGFDIVNKSES